jgi:hypothetical protein
MSSPEAWARIDLRAADELGFRRRSAPIFVFPDAFEDVSMSVTSKSAIPLFLLSFVDGRELQGCQSQLDGCCAPHSATGEIGEGDTEMRKLHWVSLALVAAPVVLMHACGGDDTSPGGTAGSGGSTTSTTGTGGSGGSGTTGTTGTAGTTGSGGTTGTAGTTGSGGTAGSKTDGGGGATEGGGGSATEGGAGSKVEGGAGSTAEGGDAPSESAVSDAGNTRTCTDPSAYMDSGLGQSCTDYCKTFLAVCNSDSALGDSGAFYANEGDCHTQCAAFSQAQLCCYAVHVQKAADADGGTRSLHCTHAAGLPGNGQCPAHP